MMRSSTSINHPSGLMFSDFSHNTETGDMRFAKTLNVKVVVDFVEGGTAAFRGHVTIGIATKAKRFHIYIWFSFRPNDISKAFIKTFV